MPKYSFIAKVKKVEGVVCQVARLGDNMKIDNVRLNEISDETTGIVIKPKVNSCVLVAVINDFNYYVSLYSDVDSIDIQCDKITINGGNNGGLINIEELKKQLNKMSQRIDGIMSALENSPVTPQDGGAAYKAGIATVLSSLTDKESFGNMEDKKITH